MERLENRNMWSSPHTVGSLPLKVVKMCFGNKKKFGKPKMHLNGCFFLTIWSTFHFWFAPSGSPPFGYCFFQLSKTHFSLFSIFQFALLIAAQTEHAATVCNDTMWRLHLSEGVVSV